MAAPFEMEAKLYMPDAGKRNRLAAFKLTRLPAVVYEYSERGQIAVT
jgi:hypothetical protein